MRIQVDFDLCIGSGMCTTYVPQLFQLNDDGTRVVVLQEDVPAGLEPATEDAIACCPVEAISAAD